MPALTKARLCCLSALAWCGAAPATADPQTYAFAEPSLDRWMYPQNATPGTRALASTFSALPSDGGVDDRFGQFLIGFETSSSHPAGLGQENYRITRASVTAVV
ncbi:MAG: hypothetical protein R3F11_22370 [Verrucomicrobiales bacterium]